MMGYPSQHLLEEVAYIAYYFHWPYEQIMSFPHRERQQWTAEIAKIHDRLREGIGE